MNARTSDGILAHGRGFCAFQADVALGAESAARCGSDRRFELLPCLVACGDKTQADEYGLGLVM